MQLIVFNVLPVFRRNDLAERILEIMRNELRHAGRAGGEVNEHRIRRLRGLLACRPVKALGEGLYGLAEAYPALALAVNDDAAPDARSLGDGGVHLLEDIFVVNADNCLYPGGIRAIHDVLFRQLKRCGDEHRAYLMQCGRTDPVLPATAQDEHDPVALFYAEAFKEVGRFVGKAADIADCVIVSVHWGNEDSFDVDDERKALAQDFADWGANIIIGNHPHVIQSMEYLDNSMGGQSFVFYSLGNFISAQSDNFNMVELLADFNVTKDLVTGEIIVDDVKAVPLVNHYDTSYSNIRVYPYSMYTEELASGHGIHTVSSGYAHDFSMSVIDGIISDNVPEQFLTIK